MVLGGALVSLAALIAAQLATPVAPPPATASSAIQPATPSPAVTSTTGGPAPVTPPPEAAVPTADPALAGAPPVASDDALIDGRRRPGAIIKLPDRVTQDNKGAVRAPPPEAFPTDQIPLPDRWRLAKTLCGDNNYVQIANACHSNFDPYHQNVLKGDRTIDTKKIPTWLPFRPKGDDWFIELSGISDTVFEPRSFPVPQNRQSNASAGGNDVFGRDFSYVGVQTFLVGAALIKGSTAYKPPEMEYRVQLAFQANYVDVNEKRVLSVNPSKRSSRFDQFVGVQELFVDRHLRNVSDRYDFDSLRVGIQPFQADFRGFLFNDNQLGVRLFGNRDNNRYQYNLAAIWRLEKDTNSGLNDVTTRPRHDYVFMANLFAQDLPVPGLTSQISATLNINRERGELKVDDNGFPVRPALLGTLRSRNYDVGYIGLSNDGHFGRLNLTSSLYYAFGSDRNSFITDQKARISAYFAAAEASYDIDWIRVRLSGLYASGDGKPNNNVEHGFDAIFENPVFAGADTSYWIRQSIPFAGGGRAISINGRNGVLNSLRSSKEQGQSNFNNPGTILAGIGADFDVLPELRVSANVNHLWFQNTKVLQLLRQEGSIPRDIGWDLSTAVVYRPSFVQNAVFRLSGAILDPGKGFSDLFTNRARDSRYYSVLLNVILSF